MFFCLFICNCGLLCTYEFKYYEVVKSDSIIEKLKKGTFSFDGNVITLASDEGWENQGSLIQAWIKESVPLISQK